MKQIILALILAVAGIGAAVAANPIREGNMISGHVLVKGSEENIPYATVLIVGSGQGTVSNEEGQFEFKNLPAGKYTLRVSAVGYKTQEKAIDIIRKSKFPQNPKRSVRFSGKRTKRSVQKRKARNTQKAETKVL